MSEITREEIITRLRLAAKDAGSQKALAFRLEVTEQYLSDVMNWKPPSEKILKALGIEKGTVYREKE